MHQKNLPSGLLPTLTFLIVIGLTSSASVMVKKDETPIIDIDAISSSGVTWQPTERDNKRDSFYAQQLFDLLAPADLDNNGEITRPEYFSWNADLRFPEEEAMTQFCEMDKNNDDSVSIGEYFIWVNKHWTNSKIYIRQTFTDADADLSGRLCLTEYVQWYRSFSNTSSGDVELEFLSADTDQDGHITIIDFLMSTFFDVSDTNVDGQLSLDEYLAQTLRYMPSTQSMASQREKDVIHFREMDADRNGLISLAELEDEMML